MMTLLRELSDNSRAVTVVTHATKSLGLCDKLVVMGARRRSSASRARPTRRASSSARETYDDIYPALESRDAHEWQQRFIAEGRATPLRPEQDGSEPERGRRKSRGRILHQARILTARYLRLFARDRRNVIILLGQIPLLGLAVAALFKSGGVRTPAEGCRDRRSS